ncbi:hypothetical protein [Plantibacter sp. YIM 135347]|uniref:hypothetical protein n=1 Tax=Plantibacter sp. YIM 135347 TaxID=3423919 RepID=UPI003D329871
MTAHLAAPTSDIRTIQPRRDAHEHGKVGAFLGVLARNIVLWGAVSAAIVGTLLLQAVVIGMVIASFVR